MQTQSISPDQLSVALEALLGVLSLCGPLGVAVAAMIRVIFNRHPQALEMMPTLVDVSEGTKEIASMHGLNPGLLQALFNFIKQVAPLIGNLMIELLLHHPVTPVPPVPPVAG